MTQPRNCLAKAKEAFKDDIDNDEIESLHDQLRKHEQRALDTGANLLDELNKYVEFDIKNRERAVKADQLKALVTMQAVVDNIARAKKWAERGVKNPVLQSLKAKVGSAFVRVHKARASTELKMLRASTTFLIRIGNDLNDAGLFPLWNSKENELQIVDAMLKFRKGEEIADPSYHKIAQIVTHYQDLYLQQLRSVGIDVSELEDRVAPNIHDTGKMMKLTRAERKYIKENGLTTYEYRRDRWKNYTLRNIDRNRTFGDVGIDPNDAKAVDEFMNITFDNLINRGKSTARGKNLANRLKEHRVLHWKDAESLADQNKQYGSGSIQDSIIRELSNGFSYIETIKDWGTNPEDTVTKTMELLDLDKEFFKREGKAKEERKIKRVLNALTRSHHEYAGTWGEFFRNVRAAELITKLGLVTLRSIPDLGLLANEASKHNVFGFNAIGEAVRNVFFNVPVEEREIFKDLMQTGITHELGSLIKYDVSGMNVNGLMAQAVRATNRLNFLEKWDNRLRGSILSILSRRMAQISHMKWSDLREQDQSILNLYDIGEAEWNVIRAAKQKVAGEKKYITPDNIQYVDDAVVKEALQLKGSERPSQTRINRFKDDVEAKLRDYYQDRQDHVILRPGVIDEDLLTAGLGLPQDNALRQAFKLFTQFKLYAVAYSRTGIATTLFQNDAVNFKEATIGGKSGVMALSKLMTYMMALKYLSMSVENAALGMTPPDVSKSKVWLKMMQEAAGLYGSFIDLDNMKDLSGTFWRNVKGAAVGDLDKAARLAWHLGDDAINNRNFKKSNKAAQNLVRGLVPRYPYSGYVTHNLLMSDWENMTNPGARRRYLRKLNKDEGVQPLF